MPNDIIVEFKAKGHPGLIAAIRALNAETDKLRGITDKATKSGGLFDVRNKRNAKGMGILGNKFSVVRSKLLLLNFAIALGGRQLLNMAKQAAKLQNMEKAFKSLTKGTGNFATSMFTLQTATKGTMSQFDLMQQANNAMILGITKNTDEMSEMFSMAKRLGDALGVDTKRAVESLVTGIGRQSRLMLDNIGIIVKSDEAYQDYAATLDKTVDELTDAEKKQAFFNAAMDAARSKVAQLGPTARTASDSFNAFGATMDNVGSAIGSTIGPVVTGFMDGVTEFINDIMQSDLEEFITDLERMGIAIADIQGLSEILAMEKANDAIKQSEEDYINFIQRIKDSNSDYIKSLGEFDVGFSQAVTQFQTLDDLTLEGVEGQLEKIIASALVLGTSTGTLTNQNRIYEEHIKKLNESLTDNADLSEGRKKLIRDDITRTQKQIDFNDKLIKTNYDQAESYSVEREQLLKLLAILKTFGDAQDVIARKGAPAPLTTDPTPGDDVAEKLSIQNTALNERAIIQAELALIEEQLAIVRAKNPDNTAEGREKKIQFEKQENSLLKNKISLNAKLVDLDGKKAAAQSDFMKKSAAAMDQLFGMSKEAAFLKALAASIDAYAAYNKALSDPSLPYPTNWLVAASALASGLANVTAIYNAINQMGGGGRASTPSYEYGGYVGGRRHSQGGTLIEAEQGEFVMSRNAVDSIGTEALNRMNLGGGGGGVNITVTGNVLTQDYVEGELAESIKEALRRGSDFGIS